MLVIDAQVHVWAADTPERPWPRAGDGGRSAEAHRATPLGPEELLAEMDAAGVDRAVLVPPSWEGERNDVSLAAARRHPDRFAVMGRIAPDRPDAPRLVEQWAQEPGALGLRLLLGGGAPWLEDGRADWLWAAAERLSLPLMLAPRGDLALVDRIAARHPALRIVVDHMAARVHRTGEAAFVDLPQLLPLARHANVAVKATALPCYSAEPYPFRDVQDPLRQVFDAFGPKRTFWGSDLSRLPCPYRQCLTLFTEELNWLSGEDLAWVMGKGIQTWLDWRPDQTRAPRAPRPPEETFK